MLARAAPQQHCESKRNTVVGHIMNLLNVEFNLNTFWIHFQIKQSRLCHLVIRVWTHIEYVQTVSYHVVRSLALGPSTIHLDLYWKVLTCWCAFLSGRARTFVRGLLNPFEWTQHTHWATLHNGFLPLRLVQGGVISMRDYLWECVRVRAVCCWGRLANYICFMFVCACELCGEAVS